MHEAALLAPSRLPAPQPPAAPQTSPGDRVPCPRCPRFACLSGDRGTGSPCGSRPGGHRTWGAGTALPSLHTAALPSPQSCSPSGMSLPRSFAARLSPNSCGSTKDGNGQRFTRLCTGQGTCTRGRDSKSCAAALPAVLPKEGGISPAPSGDQRQLARAVLNACPRPKMPPGVPLPCHAASSEVFLLPPARPLC